MDRTAGDPDGLLGAVENAKKHARALALGISTGLAATSLFYLLRHRDVVLRGLDLHAAVDTSGFIVVGSGIAVLVRYFHAAGRDLQGIRTDIQEIRDTLKQPADRQSHR